MRFNYDLSGNLTRLSASTAPFPKIVGQPANCIVEPGGTASFSVVVDDLHLVGFQWRFNGALIPEAKRDTLLITNVSAANEGEYTVVVKKGATSRTSKPAALVLDTKAKVDASPPPRLVAYSDEGGSVAISPMKLSYDLNETVTLTATPVAPSLFAGWVGEDLTGNPVTVVMDKNKTVRAKFVSAMQPPPGLLAVWRGETDANDLIGGHHGVFQVGENVAAPSLTADGRVGGAFNFDGQVHVRVPDSPSLRPSQFTIEAWVFPTVPVPTSSVSQIIIAYASPNDRHAWALALKRFGVLEFWTNLAAGRNSLASNSQEHLIPLNQWTHLAATFDGTIKRLYFNGFEAIPVGTIVSPFVYQSGTLPVTIGARLDNNIVRDPFRGLIDEVSLYNRALTADEIFTVWNSGLAGKKFAKPYFTSPSRLPDAVVGIDYAQQLTTVLGSAPISFSLADGALPPGMTLSPTGMVSGASSASGLFDFTVIAVDAAGASTEQLCLLQVS
ncbi:MAG: LamG-like jellyroll fold domain-containing protein [Pyrinomonadaceae bacterium]